MKKAMVFLLVYFAISIFDSLGAELSICSFNIQFLAASDSRDHAGLAALLKQYDIVVVQELIAPPYTGTFYDGKKFNPDPQATIFFDLMEAHGFSYLLSDEDTGPGSKNQNNGSATEWWVAFYRPDKVQPAKDLPSGFLASDRSQNHDYERVPYAFAFRSPDSTLDFVLISVHLRPGSGSKDKQRRKHEISAIADWISGSGRQEKNFIILGDMNIENSDELMDFMPSGFASLNSDCNQTNTNLNSPKPYDQILFNITDTGMIIDQASFQVIDLVSAMTSRWARISNKSFPGNPYHHNSFRKYYTDHRPVTFNVKSAAAGDIDPNP